MHALPGYKPGVAFIKAELDAVLVNKCIWFSGILRYTVDPEFKIIASPEACKVEIAYISGHIMNVIRLTIKSFLLLTQ